MKSALLIVIAIAAAAQERLPLPATGNVSLTLDEFNRLHELASKTLKKPEPPPFDYVLHSAEWKVQIRGDAAWVKLQIEGESLAKRPISVPLVSGIAVTDAQQKGRELPLQLDGKNYVALIGAPGEFSITIDAGIPLRIEPGRASLSLPAIDAGLVRLSIAVPGDHTSASLNGGIVTSRLAAAGATTVEATLRPNEASAIAWATRETAPPPAPREVRFVSEMRSVVSVREADLIVAALADITVIQGEPASFEMTIPAGYEVTAVSGPSLDSSDVQNGTLVLRVNTPAARDHHFLISLERPLSGAASEIPLPAFKGAQRETGEALVESEGTVEMTAKERGGLKRMDLKETNAYLRSMSRYSPQSAFRYHRQPGETPSLALEWVRFADAQLLGALASQATVTTLVTSEGKSLTEVKLTMSNHSQPFLRVSLPADASILSAEVAGEKVKPVQGADGGRIPLLRTGFRPTAPYPVTFVFLHSGAPFSKKGDAELALPRMDIPISLLRWEVFLPERYKTRDFTGDVVTSDLLPAGDTGGGNEFVPMADIRLDKSLRPGQFGGVVTDPSGATIAGANVTVLSTANGAITKTRTDSAGLWTVFNLPSGPVRVTVESPGFATTVRDVYYDATNPFRVSAGLQVGSVTESVEVSAADVRKESRRIERDALANAQVNAPAQASANVVNLQRRVAGVLPIAVDVPRAGTSYRFTRPLVLDEETKVRFTYRTK